MSLKDFALFVGATLPHTRSIWGMDHPAGPIIIGWDREVVGHRPDDPPTPFMRAIRIHRGPKAEAERDKARGYVRDLQRIPGYNVRTRHIEAVKAGVTAYIIIAQPLGDSWERGDPEINMRALDRGRIWTGGRSFESGDGDFFLEILEPVDTMELRKMAQAA